MDTLLKAIVGLSFIAAAILLVPGSIARFIIGGEWRQVGTAYAVWFSMLFFVLVAPKGGALDEKLGWMLLAAMFLSIIVVPAITFVLRIGGWAFARA